jgi:hypothetical protein
MKDYTYDECAKGIPKSESEVFYKIEIIYELLARNEDLLTKLEYKLGPILESLPISTDCNAKIAQPVGYRTELCGALSEIENRVIGRNQKLETIIATIVL